MSEDRCTFIHRAEESWAESQGKSGDKSGENTTDDDKKSEGQRAPISLEREKTKNILAVKVPAPKDTKVERSRRVE